jgi:hypothetical protein
MNQVNLNSNIASISEALPVAGPSPKASPALQDIIDALSAHLAILDSQGTITAVNQAWVDYADRNGGKAPDHGIGLNYLSLCQTDARDDASSPEEGSADYFAMRSCHGIRQVLNGETVKFQLTYPCHSPTEECWFLLTVTPLATDSGLGAVVANENVTTLKQHEEAITQSLVGTVETVTSMVKARDPYTAGHEHAVAQLADAIARKMALDPMTRRGLVLGAQIHDIGKITLPSEILTYPGRLSKVAMELVRTHSVAGCDLIKNIDFPWPLARIIREHHERFDGSGYPDGLAGEQICLEARIVAVADVVAAISSHRPYRPARGLAVANEEIRRGTGSIYDAEVARTFLSDEVQALAKRMYPLQS